MTTVTWTPNPDGEYNEQATAVNGQTLLIASDRDGARWFSRLDGGDMIELDATEVYEARAEALLAARLQGGE